MSERLEDDRGRYGVGFYLVVCVINRCDRTFVRERFS